MLLGVLILSLILLAAIGVTLLRTVNADAMALWAQIHMSV